MSDGKGRANKECKSLRWRVKREEGRVRVSEGEGR